MKKNLKIILIFIVITTITILFTECKKDKQINNTRSLNGDYILTSSNGKISMYNSNSKKINSLDLNGNDNSNYIYTIDQGNIYSKNLNNIKCLPKILYAVDKSNGKMSFILIKDDKLIKIKDYLLKENQIENIYAYNGIFYYSTKNKNTKANTYTYIKDQQLNKDGKLSYTNSIFLDNANQSLYIYMMNLSNEYLKYTDINKVLTENDKNMLNLPQIKEGIFEIPCNVKTWTANTQNIYFYTDLIMGQYNINKDEIILHSSSVNSISSQYIDGINKTIFSISNFGNKSQKSVLLSVDYDKMDVKKMIPIDSGNPISLNIDKSKYIMMVFKNDKSSTNFSQLKVYKYDDYSELYNIGIPYLPTKIISKDDIVYLFNPYEKYFLIGNVGSNRFSKIENDKEKYNDIFVVNKKYINDYYYDKNGNLVNHDNKLIDNNGNPIDNNSNKVNSYGQRINDKGQAINKNGQLIDRYENIINEDGKIKQYVKNKDGYYYNSQGKHVDHKGNILVRNDKGDWVEPEGLNNNGEIKITGHYDEKGNFIIDQSILDKYPNAYDIWQKSQSSDTTKK